MRHPYEDQRFCCFASKHIPMTQSPKAYCFSSMNRLTLVTCLVTFIETDVTQ